LDQIVGVFDYFLNYSSSFIALYFEKSSNMQQKMKKSLVQLPKKLQILGTRSVTNIAYYISNIAVLISKEKEENTFF